MLASFGAKFHAFDLDVLRCRARRRFFLVIISKANLLRSYSALTDEVFKESNKPVSRCVLVVIIYYLKALYVY